MDTFGGFSGIWPSTLHEGAVEKALMNEGLT